MKFSLRRKLLLLFSVISLCILITIGCFLAFFLKDEEFKIIQRDYQSHLEYIDFAISNFFDGVESDVVVLSLLEAVRVRDDKDFTNFLNADEKTFQYNIGKTEQTIIDILNNYRLAHQYVNSVYMGRENGSFVRAQKRAEPTPLSPPRRTKILQGVRL